MSDVSASPVPDRRVALAFLAHPDDAEILCGGTLIRLADAGWDIHIATCTAGDCGSMEHSADEISRIRKDEARAAAATLGGTYHCLGLLDCRFAYEPDAIRRTINVFREVAPTLVFAHAAHDYMMDHEVASMLARGASFAYGIPNVSDQPRHPESQIPYLYYCDPVEGVDPLGRPVEPTTRVDITNVHDRKLEMLACHDSQRQWLRAHHGMDEYLDATRRHAEQRGREAGLAAAEAFVQHRGHAYPTHDLLAELLA